MYPSVCCEACAGSARLIGCPESLVRKIRDSENQRTLLYVARFQCVDLRHLRKHNLHHVKYT